MACIHIYHKYTIWNQMVRVAHTIFISAISERLREFAFERYLEWSENSSAADRGGPPMSP